MTPVPFIHTPFHFPSNLSPSSCIQCPAYPYSCTYIRYIIKYDIFPIGFAFSCQFLLSSVFANFWFSNALSVQFLVLRFELAFFHFRIRFGLTPKQLKLPRISVCSMFFHTLKSCRMSSVSFLARLCRSEIPIFFVKSSSLQIISSSLYFIQVPDFGPINSVLLYQTRTVH